MSSRSKSVKLNSFLDRYGFADKMISGGAVIRLISSRCGIDFDIDPQDNLHFIGIFDPKNSSEETVSYVVKEITQEEKKMVKSKSDLLQQWEVYIDILEANFKNLLEGNFNKVILPNKPT